jgi:hypothetical protein
VPPWDAPFAANWSNPHAGAAYRTPQKQFATLSGDREPITLRKSFRNLGLAKACYTAGSARAHERLVSASPKEAPLTVADVPHWGAQLTANWSAAGAWATYHMLQEQFAALIGDREPIILHSRFPGMGATPRYMIRIADDSRENLERLCNELIAAGGACVVLRNELSFPISPPAAKGSE